MLIIFTIMKILLLTIFFIILKMKGYIDWNLWWVLSPIWLFSIWFLIAGIIGLFEEY